MLQEQRHAAEADFVFGDIRLVGPTLLVERDEPHFVPAPREFPGQRVVPDAASAEHRARAGGEAQNAHEWRRPEGVQSSGQPVTGLRQKL